MHQAPRILLVHDGELNDLEGLLVSNGLSFESRRGGEIGPSQGPPTELLVVTPRRAGTVRRGSPPGARAGCPVRIIAVEEDSNAMRRRLRQMGFHLLVRRPAHREVWRMLVQRSLYQGEERREQLRIPLGATVSVRSPEERSKTLLLDISNRGCRLLSDEPFEQGGRVCFEIPGEMMGGPPLPLSGEIVRATRQAHSEPVRFAGVAIFDATLAEESRRRLSQLLNSLSAGPPSAAPDDETGLPPVPARESGEFPGLRLDAETDPELRAGFGVEVRSESGEGAGPEPGDEAGGAERREQPRGSFERIVQGHSAGRSLILMGRDLSSGGMRVERLPGLWPGQRFRLAIYGPTQAAPFVVRARVARDDGEHGLALHFEDVAPELARELDKVVAALPQVEALDQDECGGMGAVLSEIVGPS